MSGGKFNYQNDYIGKEIFDWRVSPDYGEKGFSQSKKARTINPMEDKMVSEIVYDVFCLIHSLDWYKSGDICQETYEEDIKFFKDKWFSKKKSADLIKTEIDKTLEEAKEELYKTFGLKIENLDTE